MNQLLLCNSLRSSLELRRRNIRCTTSLRSSPRCSPIAVLAGGSAANLSFLSRKLKAHGCPNDVTNIAIPGTTASQWSEGNYLATLTKAAPKHTHVWITLMGNDALEQMPTCAASGKTSDECGDQLYEDMLTKMGSIIDAIHGANPDAEVVGMGYEMMFGGAGCGLVPATLFPQCWKGEAGENDESSIRCFNEQVIRMQAVWDELAEEREYVTALNILGLTQMKDGDETAQVGKPNMEVRSGRGLARGAKRRSDVNSDVNIPARGAKRRPTTPQTPPSWRSEATSNDATDTSFLEE